MRIAAMDVTVDDQIDIVPVDNLGQLAVAEQEELEIRFVAKRSHRWRNMGNHYFEISIKLGKRCIQAGRFPAAPHGQCLRGARGESYRGPHAAKIRRRNLARRQNRPGYSRPRSPGSCHSEM